ncbi:MAG: glycogen phosphorylase [Deltaproteobacteria bacterium]|nr:MAG: glycogen phosphorylase [Deltaproteobacteria bacterium]
MKAQDKVTIEVEDDRTGMHPATLERAVLDHLYYTCAKDERSATLHDVYIAIAHTVRDRLAYRWRKTQRTYYDTDAKRVYYISAEFLLGRALDRNMRSLGVRDMSEELLAKYGVALEDVLAQEPDPGLGNGGLGRLAACFLESMATLGLPGMGYGIRYEYGIFEQLIEDGWQHERGDAWLLNENPWEIPRRDRIATVQYYGRVLAGVDEQGNYRARWVDTQNVLGVPHDMPVPGAENGTVNTLRLWAARASQEFNLDLFNSGDYRRAVEEKALTESISKVLYPSDESHEGKELRLRQQYFFVACSIHDILRRFKKDHSDFRELPDKVAIQLNDTHPAVAVAELMRVLMDEEGIGWDLAWEITQKTVAYTNHTLMPEALERWPVAMFERMLPRHLQIIYEINRRFLREVQIHDPSDQGRLARMSIIQEKPTREIRMAHLATVGSHSVNGVAALHSELVKTQLLPDFARLWPDKFNNKTNGVTPRRWLAAANPDLAAIITDRVGKGWHTDLDRVAGLADHIDDEELHQALREAKRINKQRLAAVLAKHMGANLSVDSLFDVQVKRMHEYKRQLLNCLHIVAHYLELKRNPGADTVPRTFIFGGKAAPGYRVAKLHIKLINDVAETIAVDPAMKGRLSVVFVPNYGVSLAERIFPASDLSEQISTAGMEASGTGNMKFTMNGALTIGTLDGANIEIREAVGAENFFLFGKNAAEVRGEKAAGYEPGRYIEESGVLAEVLDTIEGGFFNPDEVERYAELVGHLRHVDPYLCCADFEDYIRAQGEVDQRYRDETWWAKAVIQNIAHTGHFSSDRTIREYASDIWDAKPVPVPIPTGASERPPPRH